MVSVPRSGVMAAGARRVRCFGRRAAALSLAGLATVAAAAAEGPDPAGLPDPAPLMVPRGGIVAGQALEWYAQDWWQWAFSMPRDQSPVEDRDGRFCHIGQRGQVWYLAGGYGSAHIHRTCAVPADRHLFFPIVNYVATTRPGDVRPCPAALEQVAQDHDQYVHLRVEVDGIPLDDLHSMRIAPETCFDLAARATPDLSGGAHYPSATDGYWVMLAPLPPPATTT